MSKAILSKWKWMILPLVLLLLIAVIFAGWHIQPSSTLDVVVLDKTISDNAGSILDYRKHYGMFWMLNQLKINRADGKPYEYATDYYGVHADGDHPLSSLDTLDRTPHLLYLSDTYGADDKPAGLTYGDIAAASVAFRNGATLIAECDITSAAEETVIREVESLFGLKYTSWMGRYIADMADLTDVPVWALDLHQTVYGRPWDYKGAGILLAGGGGELVILEQDKDFDGAMLTVEITGEHRDAFGSRQVNYYNWFEIIEADYDTETVALYHLGLNEAGKTKFARIADGTSFPAVVRRAGVRSSAYYFAGDFNDYIANERYGRFLFSDRLYRTFSYDKPGDVTNFYWKFYYPVMKSILRETEKNKDRVVQPQANTSRVSRIRDGRFEVQTDGQWAPFMIRGFNLRGEMPGAQPGSYTRDIAVYRRFIDDIAAMGGNSVRVYDRMPPEFYRALYEYNHSQANRGDGPPAYMYFFQSLATPSSVNPADALDDVPLAAWKTDIQATVDAVHGRLRDTASSMAYNQDVSAYLIGFIVEPAVDPDTLAALNKRAGLRYDGLYVGASASAAECLAAILCDHVFTYHRDAYGYTLPIGVLGNAATVTGVPWADTTRTVYDVDRLTATDKAEGDFFTAYSLQPHDQALLDNAPAYEGYMDEDGAFAYGGYIQALLRSQSHHPVLVDRFGLSTHANTFERETSVNGLSEEEQGKGLVRMHKAIEKQGFLGGLISDYNDNWAECADELAEYVLPQKNNPLWHNALDRTQNRGLLAVEPLYNGEIGMSLKDNDRMQELQTASDAAYLYITLMLDGAVNYDREQLVIGLDTYQRNNGEYLYDPSYFATSLSGMEYVIKFEGKNSASLYVVPSYNRDQQRYASREEYGGQFDYICSLPYGLFDTSNSYFYQVGSTIRLRIPWSLLNFTDPSQKIVLNDPRSAGEIAGDGFNIQTTATDGILFSVLIAEKATGESLYVFPVDKQDSGYKAYKWDAWTAVGYTFRQKVGCKILSRYFASAD